MNAFISVDRLFSEAIVERLGWVLVHSLWQFAAVAILAVVFSAALSRRSATARYSVLVITMAVTVVAPCVTWMFIPASGWASALRENAVATESQPSNASEDESIGDAKLGPTGSEIAISLSAFEKPTVADLKINEQTRRADAQPLAESWKNILRPWFTWIVGGWVIGVLLCSLRPLLGWRMLRRLRRVGISPPSDEVVAALQKISQRLGMRRAVQILHSTLATGPLVVGYLRPVVLLPVSLVTNIPMSQLEAILAHELAHIRRHDFAINLAQTLVETLFFYHPAVWWLSRQIRIEREHCCDDLVVKRLNNGIDYGRALLAIQQIQTQRSVLALGAADGSLLARIRRITGTRTPQPRSFPFMAIAIVAVVICGVWMAGQEFTYSTVGDEPKPEAASIANASDESSETKFDPLRADLPSGIAVELLGATTPVMDAIQYNDGQWWNPDGTSLPASPIRGDSLRLSENRTDGCVFAFRLTGRQAFYAPDVKFEFLKNGQTVKSLEGQKAWSEFRITRNPATLSSILEIAAGPASNADSVNIDLRLVSHSQGKIRFNQQGQSLDDSYLSNPLLNSAVNRLFRRVHVLRAGLHNDGFAVWTDEFDSKNNDGQVMLEVEDGRASYLSSEVELDGSEQRYSLNISADDVQYFAFQFYPYDHQVSVRNVALRAGQKYEPKTIVRSIASQTIGEQEARDTLSEMYPDLIEFVPAADGLQDLHVRNLPTAGWQFFSLLTHIRAIQIQGGNLHYIAMQHIAKIPGLKSLTIVGAKCVPEDLRYLRQHSTLENLNVELTTQDELADDKERMNIWTHTQFAERQWIESNLPRLFKRFPDDVVNRRRLEAAVLTDRSIWNLDELKSLKSLRLVNSPVSGKSLRAFTELPNLQHLKIEVIDPTTETGATLASFPSLRSFGTIEGNPDVFPQLSFSKTLEELEVSWLNDEGVDDLLQMSQLKRLHLHSSEMSDIGLLKLAQLDRLTDLSLTATKGTITDEGTVRLRILMPNCKLTIEKTPVAAVGNSIVQKPDVEDEASGTAQVSHFAETPKDETGQLLRLPNGSVIELPGVSTPPIEMPSKDNREWWKGDGTTMDAAPISRGSIHVGPSRNDGREFVFRMTEMAAQSPEHARLTQLFKDGQPYKADSNGWSQSSVHWDHPDKDQKDSRQATIEHVAGPVGDADSATLEVRLGSELSAEMLFDSNGKRANGDSNEDVWQLLVVQKMAERIEVLRTGEHEDGFAIWTKPFSSSTDEGNLNVVLIDATGQRHHPFGSSSDGNENVFSFKIKPEEVDAIVIRLRPFQYLVTFENVSLKPGRKSDVRISVKSPGL